MQPCTRTVIDTFGLQSSGYFVHYLGVVRMELQCTASLYGHFTQNLCQYSICWFHVLTPHHQLYAWCNGSARFLQSILQ